MIHIPLEEYSLKIVSSIQRTEYKFNKSYHNDIKILIKSKHKLRRKWQRNRLPHLKTELNRETKELTFLINEFENKSLQKYLSELSSDKRTEYSLWKATKTFQKPETQFHPIKMDNGKWAKRNHEKAGLFSEYLAKTFTPNDGSDAESLDGCYLLESVEIDPCTRQEVSLLIKNLKPIKAPGFDLITSEILAEIPKRTLENLT